MKKSCKTCRIVHCSGRALPDKVGAGNMSCWRKNSARKAPNKSHGEMPYDAVAGYIVECALDALKQFGPPRRISMELFTGTIGAYEIGCAAYLIAGCP